MSLFVFFLYTSPLIIAVILAVYLIIKKRHNIISYFQPQNYVFITMLEMDDSISSWLMRKTKDLRFTFNEGIYNMFHKGIYDTTGKLHKHTAIYRTGRLAQFFYVEGNSDPIDFRNIKSTAQPYMTKELQKLDITKMFEEDLTGLDNFLKKYGLYIALAGLALLFILTTNGG